MTGPEHYSEAERIIGTMADQHVTDVMLERDTYKEAMLLAQVHATLALAAAAALNPLAPGDWLEWIKAAGGKQQEATRGRA